MKNPLEIAMAVPVIGRNQRKPALEFRLSNRLSAGLTFVVAALLAGDCTAQSDGHLDFNIHIRPLLSRTCFPCHGPDEQARQADLRLNTREGAFRKAKPVIAAGQADSSLLIERITSRDQQARMPPPDAKQQLTEVEIEILRRWIGEGAVWSEHWSFQPIPAQPHRVAIPDKDWSQDVIDDSIQARLHSHRLHPSPEAETATLLRRATLDLVGLPPSLKEQAQFREDRRPDQYERLIDRLLASPHFGERWGRHWLDAARYADSAGFEGDPPRAVWKYRDWVLNAFNQDMPFDQFVIRQLAGDLLPDRSIDDRVATGFLLQSQQDGGSEPSRLDAVVDRVNTVGTVFLGLSVGCAQCHSHKFDPLSQREYYSLFAFVNAADEFKLEFATPEQLARRDALNSQLASLKAERTAYAAALSADQLKTDSGYLERTATIDNLSGRIPHFESTLVLQTASPERVTTTFIRGDFARPGEAVKPDFPSLLQAAFATKASRLDLARWLVSPDHPLTSRVTVNRIWQQLFGRGIVETENDFGTQGAAPTHPELLDWLASEFSRRGWRTKALIRRLVCSAVYRQSSTRRTDLDSVDPENRLLARQSRLRLEAEVIRDAALTASGLLSTKIGGPSVFPFQHDGIMINRATPAPWEISPGEDRYRRGLYTHYWRLTPHPQLQTFDAPDAITACTHRTTSNTPLQALTLLNDPTFTEAASHLAQQITELGSCNEEEQIRYAFQVSLSRLPSKDEFDFFKQLLNTVRLRKNKETSIKTDTTGENELAVWTLMTTTLFNLEEFIVRE